MKELLKWDSPWVQKLAIITNLVMLNILWLICCLPIFTAGAATTALYYTIFQYQVEGNDAVLQPFFHAFRVNFKQTTLLWIPLFLISILLIFDTFFLLTNGGKILQWVMLMLALMMDVAILTYLFPLIARFEMRGKGLLSTALSLFVLHLPASLVMILVNLVPILFFTLSPMAFLRWSILWFGIWFASAAYLNGKILLKIWGKHKSR